MRFTGLSLRVLLCLLWATAAMGAPRTDLNHDWQFRVDPEGSGEAFGWNKAIPRDTETVRLPHTWNIGRWHDYLGVAWYFREFDLPSNAAGHVELHFGATFYQSHVWLNGVEIGQHEGGFTAYSFDITPQLRAHNVLIVRLDNRPGVATIPGFAERGSPKAWYDWWAYGGIVRDVWLTSTGPVWVRRQSIRSEQHTGESVVHDRIFLGDALSKPAAITVLAHVFDSDNRSQALESQVVTPAAGGAEVSLSLHLANPRLWSIDHPSLYRMEVEIRDAHNSLLDKDTASFGVRSFEIRDRHLLVNGERVRLTGITRHEDSPWEGLAETRGTIVKDYDDLKALHTTLTRPVHYPQNPLVLDYADRHGIMLIPEIPIWQFSEAQLSDPKVIALAEQQMREMIEEAGNHPSIFGWSVANESATGTPGGIAYVRAMRDMIHAIDPGRPVTFADDNLPKLERREQSAAADADFILMNQYFGSWHGPAEALNAALDKVDRLFPDKMVIISEMGFAGIFAKDSVSADLARINTIRTQMPVLAARDWIAGAILWCYQDYKSPRNLWPGQTEGFVDHGLVDENRQRRPSYAVWQEVTVPATLTLQWTGAATSPTGISVRVQPNTESNLPYYPLHQYRLSLRLVDPLGKILTSAEHVLSDGPAPITIADAIPTGATSQALKLIATLQSPAGEVAATQTLNWQP